MTGFTQEYLVPFLLLLGGRPGHIGALSALPNLFGSLVQLKSADLTEKVKSRKKVINLFVSLQALMLLPMVITALLGKTGPTVFIGIVILFTSFGALATPCWGSLMSDLVSEDKRGQYFGYRNRALGFVTVISTFIAGFILHMMKEINIFYGFGILFSLAFIFRIISRYFLGRMYEPPLAYKKEDSFTFIEFLARIRESNFAKFVLFVSMMNLSVNIASPFFAVLMLRDLHFSYLLYTLITIIATLTIHVMISPWGKLADKIGNIKVIRFTSPLIGIIPLLWILSRDPIFLSFAQLISGFAWAGFSLSTSNFIYDAVRPEKRTRCISYFNVLNGLGLCLGALLGGFLLHTLPPIFGHNILTLFLLSSILRLLVGLLIPMRLKEVRTVEEISNGRLFLSVVGLRPLLERKVGI